MRFYDFFGFIAACMALNALAIDVMLPALPDITNDLLLVTRTRRRQSSRSIWWVWGCRS